MFSIVPPSNYRRRPRVRFASHWARKERAAAFGRVVDVSIFFAAVLALGAFTLHAFGAL